MSAARCQAWFFPLVVVGAVYAVVGIVFALPATHVRAWRLAAWAVSGVAYAIHVAYECFRLRNSSLTAALHVALAVALGAFGLAVGAVAHSVSATTSSEHQRLVRLALVTWPLITGLPAFLVGLATCGLLGRVSRRSHVG